VVSAVVSINQGGDIFGDIVGEIWAEFLFEPKIHADFFGFHFSSQSH
jgi:hypothetical protein